MRIRISFLCFAWAWIAAYHCPFAVAESFFGDCDSCCDVDSCDGSGSSLIRRQIIPGMFGDGGLLIPRTNVPTGGLQTIFQNHTYKVAENNSALPQDRLGFNFNALQDVYNGLLDTRVDDNLYEYRLFGEKTFWGGRASVDLMVPLYVTSQYEYEAADVIANGPDTAGAFGNLAFGFKGLVYESNSWAHSVGLRIEAPTGDEIVSPPALNLFYRSFNDDVWNFTPYVASLWTPSERVFAQSFLSYRMNTGSKQEIEAPLAIREQEYFMADVGIGYWLYQNPHGKFLTGLAPVLELHYTGAWQLETPITTETNLIYGNSDRLNLTAGLSALFGSRCSAGMAIAAPLRSNVAEGISYATIETDRAYDWALLTQVTYYFGR